MSMKSAILIVDDQPSNLKLSATLLEDFGARMILAINGAEALNRLHEQEFALVLLDLHMPVLNGFEVLQRMADMEAERRPPVILVTAVHDDLESISRGYALGAVDYLVRPFHAEFLRSKVRVFLELDRRNRLIRKQAAELEAHGRALERARIQAEAAIRAKNQFLDNMGHEIRTPMNAIIGMTDLVLMSNLEPTQRKLLEIVLRSSESLLSLLNDILDFSRLEADRLDLDQTLCSVHQVVEHAVTTMAVEAELKGLTLNWVVEPQVPEWVVGDPVRLRQILVQVLNNAVKFTRHGGVELRVNMVGEERLAFQVQDSGIGIPEDRLEMIFEGFSQVDGSTTRCFGGTGLGLALCRKLVTCMQGELRVMSRVGEGSTFTFEIPCIRSKAGDGSASSLSSAVGVEKVEPDRERSMIRILLVEDDQDNRLLGQHVLTSAGYAVTTAGDGEEALPHLCEGFDLVFIDVQMPRLNGIEATRRIRAGKEKADPDMPIIGVSGHVQEQLRAHCLEAGMDAFLTKPYRSQDLLDLVARAGEFRARREEQRRVVSLGSGRNGGRS
ncbi:MAG: response regulator [Magnetococcales bacterium]|nr:response regulator [Magnetococcales bacterium]NGZ04853.1 response regulator [Magnetococcales bacterium]